MTHNNKLLPQLPIVEGKVPVKRLSSMSKVCQKGNSNSVNYEVHHGKKLTLKDAQSPMELGRDPEKKFS